MSRKKILTIEQHKKLAIELQELQARTQTASITLLDNLPHRHETIAKIDRILKEFDQLRLMLDKVHREHHGADGPYHGEVPARGIRQLEPPTNQD